jgi:hypothetical protein
LWRIRDKTSENRYTGQKIQIHTQQTNKYKSINITDIKKGTLKRVKKKKKLVYISFKSIPNLPALLQRKKHLLYCREKTPALLQRKNTCFTAEKKHLLCCRE